MYKSKAIYSFLYCTIHIIRYYTGTIIYIYICILTYRIYYYDVYYSCERGREVYDINDCVYEYTQIEQPRARI